jgi:hypothetical protein
VPDSSDTTFDTSIPVLNEILVPGKPAQARPTHGADAAAAGPEAEVASAEAAAQPSVEPADDVTVYAVTPAHVQAFELPEPPTPFELASAPEPLELPPVPEPVEAFEPSSAFHFARAPAAAAPAHNLDADVIAERLRGRFASYLTGEGRAVIEARCRDALQDHTTWLVNQITREVALTLETEMTGWVREAINEEIARRSTGH